ncbi:MAG: hypothetical protein JO307_12680 [Bryobacterales bacterium]|nr:hypothetical protein [Bryobacterales bacterium]MBV9399973.1 hypothetical protein [Bryobacterales bacterium]
MKPYRKYLYLLTFGAADSQSRHVYFGANLVYGAPQDSGQPINGCPTQAISPSDGFEIYGANHFFYDNGVHGHNGTIYFSTIGGLGMPIGPPASGIYISQSDPWDPSDTKKDIYNSNDGPGLGVATSRLMILTSMEILAMACIWIRSTRLYLAPAYVCTAME